MQILKGELIIRHENPRTALETWVGLGHSVKELAEKTGLHVRTVRGALTGKSRRPTQVALSHATGLDAEVIQKNQAYETWKFIFLSNDYVTAWGVEELPPTGLALNLIKRIDQSYLYAVHAGPRDPDLEYNPTHYWEEDTDLIDYMVEKNWIYLDQGDLLLTENCSLALVIAKGGTP